MSLPRLRLEKCRLEDGIWHIDAEQAHHLTRVRRCKTGSHVEGLLEGIKIKLKLICDEDSVRASEISREMETRSQIEVHLLLPLLKNDQFDIALRSAAELGVHAVHLLDCERSVPKYSGAKLEDKMLRWRKILDEATKQAASTTPPILTPPAALEGFDFSSLPDARFAAIIDDNSQGLAGLGFEGSVAAAIGPEGDWSPQEIKLLLDNGFTPIKLGKRILRASTAATVVCGWFTLSCSQTKPFQ